LSQFILAFLIAGYFVVSLLMPRASRPAPRTLLTGFFGCMTLLFLLFFLDASFSPTDRLSALFPQTTVLALGILLLLQFAYRFPQPFPHKWEARLVLASSLAYLLFEAGYAVYRFYLLSAWGYVIYRPQWADYPVALGLLWAPVILLRQAAADLTPRRRGEPHTDVVATAPAGEDLSPLPPSPARRWGTALPLPSQGRGAGGLGAAYPLGSCAACSTPKARPRARRGPWR
jgi:hypothetical protein